MKLLSGFDRFRSDNCLTIWDINHHGLSSSSSQTLNSNSDSNEEYKRMDLLMHNQQMWRPFFTYGMGEQCHSLTWFKPNEKLFAAATTQHNTRYIRIYDHRGLFILSPPSHSLLLLPLIIEAPTPNVMGFATKAPYHLCADPSEKYLAATSEVNSLMNQWIEKRFLFHLI